MEWVTAILGALVGVLGMQVLHWRTLAKLGARVRKLEIAVEELQNPEPEDDDAPYGQQCVDLNDEYHALLTKLPEHVVQMSSPLPVVRHMTVSGLLNLLPRKGIRVQPSLDGMGIKVVASYHCLREYRGDVGADLIDDMRQLVKNTGPDWELTTFENVALQQHEFRILNHDGSVHE